MEWQNPVDSSWQVVNGWQGELDDTDSGAAFKQWAVDRRDYGTGPFRWVLCVEKDGAVMATSQSFKLPTDSSANLVMVLNASATRAAASATPTTLSSWTQNEGFAQRARRLRESR